MLSSVHREPEIDGLRSLAIVPVVLYHAGWTVLPGGFVGVDIFFVISGYLITRILDREIAAGEFSLLRFYERRARRIMPALFLVLVVCAAIAVLILMPDDLVRFARSLLSTVLFASNFYFFQNSGYFDAASDSYALLHTWSLAVEEQFYLLFPLVLWAAFRLLGRHRGWAIAGLAIVSLGLSIALSARDPEFAFYLPMTRAWELLAGSLLALGSIPQLASRLVREFLAGLSLLAVVGTVLLLRQHVAFPGWVAAIPVLGAAGLIQFSRGTVTGRLLTLKPLVGVGLVSYSLYLWHWPLLVFGAYWLTYPLTVWARTAVAVLSLILAIVTWKLVEQPFRIRKFLTRRTVFAVTAAAIVVVCGVGSLAIAGKGLPFRLPPEVVRLAAFADDVSPKRQQCYNVAHDIPPIAVCSFGANPAAPTVAVWGDSHGVELSYALGEVAVKYGKTVLELTRGACRPGVGLDRPSETSDCGRHNRKVFRFLSQHAEIVTIILVAHRIHDDPGYIKRTVDVIEPVAAQLKAMGRNVVIVYPVPSSTVPVPQLLATEMLHFGSLDPNEMTTSAYRARISHTLHRLDEIVAKLQLTAVHPTDVVCPQERCFSYLDPTVMYFDQQHPSLSGARLLAPLFEPILAIPDPPASPQGTPPAASGGP